MADTHPEPGLPPSPSWLDGDVVAGLAAEERSQVDVEAAERVRADWATTSLTDRLSGSLGRTVTVALAGDHRLSGTLADSGRDWLVLAEARDRRVVNVAAVLTVEGLGATAAPATSEVGRRLGAGHALRSLASTGRPVRLLLVDGGQLDGSLLRVMADAVDLIRHPVDRAPASADGMVSVPWTAVAAVVHG